MTVNGNMFTAAELRRLASACLLDAPPSLETGEPSARKADELNSGPNVGDGAAVKPAAVLVPIRDQGSNATVILTERSSQMPTHAGQISFPGGGLAQPTESPLQAALREASEEIGLDRKDVTVIGYLDSYLTGTDYLIAPVVAVVSAAFTPVIEEREVASVFEVPLAFLMNPANHQIHQREWRGGIRRYHAISWRDRYIWGATAGMLKNLYDRVYGI